MDEWTIDSWMFPASAGIPEPVAPYAHATAAGPLVFVTGQLPVEPATGKVVGGGIGVQTDQVLSNLARVLGLTGSGLGRVVQARAYLTDMSMYADFNRAYCAWFPDRLPSRTCVGVTALAFGALVEIEVVALRD
ncbi:MAG TPA: RidA family protein [Acidimicrobiales bacterium]|nr:RidA family protein [Acidimicrobiales bacterium]